MNPVLLPYQLAVALSASLLFISACSDSDSGQPSGAGQVLVPNGAGNPASGEASGGSGGQEQPVSNPAAQDPTMTGAVVSDPQVQNPAVQTPSNQIPAVENPVIQIPATQMPAVQDPVVQNPIVQNPVVQNPVVQNPPVLTPVVPDPLVQNSTSVEFNVEVPAYQSNALQVLLSWGDKQFTAAWIGDEFWSATGEFPSDTENPLTVTFSDRNGEITLGSFEAMFKTGVNASESYQITANQFDTASWDSDGDGQSNLTDESPLPEPSNAGRVLIFSEARGYAHESTRTAVGTLGQMAISIDYQSDSASDSQGVFTDANLARYDAIIWLLTSGDVLDEAEQAAFERYIRAGGGYVGIHAASDTEYDWPWYGGLVGAYFARHPEIQSASQTVEDGSHPSTAHLGSTWVRTDEWYDYGSNPRERVNVLLSLDENSYVGGGMGGDHPSAWYHDYDGGRSWYTGGGHTIESYADPLFRQHIIGGLQYAVGQGG